MALFVRPGLEIPEDELTYRASRASGPGGQNVNKVESRVEVRFDVPQSTVLSEAQKTRIAERLATRINKDGVLRVVSQKHRTQAANREAARVKLGELVAAALEVPKKRTRTRVSKGAKKRRLEAKRRRSEVKRGRRAGDFRNES
ncbi:MAG: alternative ribosome rescue aminoacyl-tRNA hydrolase ArfB [Acidobacteriota bacterium]